MKPLEGQVAVVTGASRGVGKGVALGLGEAGATVYVTGRSTLRGAAPGTIGETADAVTEMGGRGVAVPCDHADDAQVEALFARVLREAKRVDILVNNAFSIPEGRINAPFWQLPIEQWDTMHRVGLRSHYVASWYAAHVMLAQRRGLIANISSFGALIQAVSVPYGVGKAALDRMSRDMGRELASHGVCVVSLWPGIVKTERPLMEPDRYGIEPSGEESPLFTGRAVAALAADPNRLERTGQALVVAELAHEYGFSDVDGTRPPSLRLKSPLGER